MNHELKEEQEVVPCFDEMNRICWNGIGWKTIIGLIVVFGFAIIGSMTGMDWFVVLGVGLVMSLVAVHVFQIHQGYSRLRCPVCQKKAGKYKTVNSRIHLVCKHCETVSPTDCGVSYEGGPPVKIVEK